LLKSSGVERVADKNERAAVLDLFGFKIGMEFGEAAALSVAESINLIKENPDASALPGFDHLHDAALSEEGKNDLPKGSS
jgi:hypothetical protein